MSPHLRILAVTHRYPPYVAGGYELRTRDVVEALRTRGHEVTVLAGRGDAFEDSRVVAELQPALVQGEAPFDRVDTATNLERFRLHFFRTANWLATVRALERVTPDLVVYYNLGLTSLAPLLAARHAGVPVLGDVSDPWPENHWVRAWRQNLDRAGGAKALRLEALQAAWRGFRGLVGLGPMLVPSHFLRSRLVADGLAADEIAVLPTALSPEGFRLPDPAPPHAGGSEPRGAEAPLRILSTSSLWEGKGVHVLIEASRRAVLAGCALELAIAGTGPQAYRTRLEEIASCPELAGRVRFLGQVSREEVARELCRADLFAFPSLWDEPFARAPLEAMASGVCVLCSDAGGNAELLDHRVEGWIAPAGDTGAWAAALQHLCSDSALRLRLAEAARRRVRERHDFGKYIDSVEAACLRAAGKAA